MHNRLINDAKALCSLRRSARAHKDKAVRHGYDASAMRKERSLLDKDDPRREKLAEAIAGSKRARDDHQREFLRLQQLFEKKKKEVLHSASVLTVLDE